ncbi:MAG TPA: hypothetical protein VM754_12925 [Actinomycetota bacterium]|nr:hypothetical protein [Actinomycetota bacterium]
MEATYISDDACERIISGSLGPDEHELVPVRWLVEDLQSLYNLPVPRAARALHPSTSARPAGSAGIGYSVTRTLRLWGRHPQD